ncbi:hypothetical protein FQN50_009101 [Emmonsiellopsis sp. PD_5]|nr:hypothetical protein FQN50_009101 [Emmonsiellopsis sp. PD_5]
MPYLETSQEYLEQSALLLEAYPDTTRITTKYSYPATPKPSSASSKSKPTEPAPTTTSKPPAETPATLTLKTYHPTSGICLKYRTNKAAEIGRLIAGLGKLASGAPVVETVAAAAGTATQVPTQGGDVEMVDVSGAATGQGQGKGGAQGGGAGAGTGGGKGKKKGKGKR